jgi:thiosulfate/3-mercaptopyruvate sulfurtransferase
MSRLSSDYIYPESLVSTQWVADHLADPNVRVVEVIWGDSDNWGTGAYCSGHIPGAVAWDFARPARPGAQ